MGIKSDVYTSVPQHASHMLRQALLEVQSENELMKAAKSHQVDMRVADCRSFNKRGMALLLELRGSPSGMRETVPAIRHLKGIRHVVEGKHYGDLTSLLVIMDKPAVCLASIDQTIICLECPLNSKEDAMPWRFVFQKPSDLRQIIKKLSKAGVSARIRDLSFLNEKRTLTARQLEVIRAAAEMGYFEFPRKIGLTELSQFLGVKPSTLSEVIRSAERRIVQYVIQPPADVAFT
jgi:hypothetical protein